MSTLSLILFDNKEDEVLQEETADAPTVYSWLEDLTERYEQNGLFFVNEVRVGTNALVREFATIKAGLCISLIICGGRAVNVNSTKD